MTRMIWLIGEDETDAEVVRAILRARECAVDVRFLQGKHKVGGVSRLAAQLEALIKTALAGKSAGDCIAVLHDADEQTQLDRGPYDQIKQICQRCRQDVILIIACDEIESWLLADGGLCRWLGIKPKNRDEHANPKDELNRLLKKKKMRYRGPDRAKVLKHLDGNGDQRSPSMRRAVQHFENSPCG